MYGSNHLSFRQDKIRAIVEAYAEHRCRPRRPNHQKGEVANADRAALDNPQVQVAEAPEFMAIMGALVVREGG